MLPYFMVLFIVLGGLVLSYYRPQSQQKIYFGLSVLLFLFAACRGTGNGDYETYQEYALKITTFQQVFDESFPMEIGFRTLSYVMNLLSLPSQFIIVSLNALSLGILTYVIHKRSLHPVLSWVIHMPYLLTFDMHASRIAISMAAGCLALHYLIDKRHQRALFAMIFAFFFHRSALILFSLFVIQRLSSRCLMSISLIGILTSLFIQWPLVIANGLTLMGAVRLGAKLESYWVNERFGYALSLLDPRVLLVALIVLIGACYFKRFKALHQFLYKTILVGFTCLIMFHGNTFIALRLSTYFLYALVLFLPELVSYLNATILTFVRWDEYRSPLARYRCVVLLHRHIGVWLIASIYLVYGAVTVLLNCVPYLPFFMRH